MKIAIDPGHGMSNRSQGVFDPGAVCRVDGIIYQEADIVLSYGLTLRQQLETAGHEVFMTRADNEADTPLIERTRRAENEGCQAFISLHTNAHPDPTANGLEIYFKGKDARGFAKMIQDELLSTTGMRNRGFHPIRGAGAKVRFDGIAILVELGFLTNAGDRKRVLGIDREAEVCQAICRVVKNTVAASTQQS